jgi:DNA-binding XRE family transcriptional regulator
MTIVMLRKSCDISQAELAARSGVDRKTVNRIENNAYSPSLETFFRICGGLGVKPIDVMRSASKRSEQSA